MQIYEKFKASGFNANIKLYLKDLESPDEQLLVDLKYSLDKIKILKDQLLDQKPIYYQIFGIKPNGASFPQSALC